MARAIAFYGGAFDAQPLTAPYRREGPEAETTWGGLRGVSYQVCHLAFDAGVIELFRFDSPGGLAPNSPLDPTAGQLHFGMHVDDVAATLARVESCGGSRLWPEIRQMAEDVAIIYVADPDGNVIELADATMSRIAGVIIASQHDAVVGAAAAPDGAP
jgi:catechol 2,3-dioxygenase-like lactoylglutathione lyase family enzyme